MLQHRNALYILVSIMVALKSSQAVAAPFCNKISGIFNPPTFTLDKTTCRSIPGDSIGLAQAYPSDMLRHTGIMGQLCSSGSPSNLFSAITSETFVGKKDGASHYNISFTCSDRRLLSNVFAFYDTPPVDIAVDPIIIYQPIGVEAPRNSSGAYQLNLLEPAEIFSTARFSGALNLYDPRQISFLIQGFYLNGGGQNTFNQFNGSNANGLAYKFRILPNRLGESVVSFASATLGYNNVGELNYSNNAQTARVSVVEQPFDLSITEQHYEQPAGTLAKVAADGTVLLDFNVPAVLVFTTKAVGLNSTTFSPLVFSYINNFLAATLPISLTQLSIGPVITRSPFIPSLAGVFTGTVRVDAVGAPVAETYLDNNTSKRTVAVLNRANIEIDSVRVGQVLWNPALAGRSGVTLVAEKTAAAEITLKGSGDLNSGEPFVVSVEAGDLTFTSSVHTLREFVNSKLVIDAKELKFKPLAGMTSLKPKVVPTNDYAIKSSASYTQSISVEKTSPLRIGMFPLNGVSASTNCIIAPTTAQVETQIEKTSFLESIFPVPDGGINLVSSPAQIGSCDNTLVRDDFNQFISRGILEDLRTLQKRKVSGFSRAVGIVGNTYFDYHKEKSNTSGFAYNAEALVKADTKSILGHELVHTLAGYNVSCAEGYECQQELLIDGYDALQGVKKQRLFSVMDVDRNVNDVWIDAERYGLIFETLRKPNIDPELLIVSGFYNTSGTFEVSEVIRRDAGILTNSDPAGRLQISTRNNIGQILNEVKLEPSFKLIRTYSDGLVPDGSSTAVISPFVPVTIAIPFSNSVTSIAISSANGTTQSLDVNSMSLKSSIAMIPSTAFRTSEKSLRKLFAAELVLIDKAIAAGNFCIVVSLIDSLRLEIGLTIKDFEDPANGFNRKELFASLRAARDSFEGRIQTSRGRKLCF